MSKTIIYLIQTLQTPERLYFISRNLQLFPELNIFNSINGYDIDETKNAFLESGLKFHNLQFMTYGTLANALSKINALKYQIENKIDYMCLLEDDLILKEQFKNFVESNLYLLENCNMLRLCNWGECYVTSIDGAKNILKHIYNDGIIKNIDNQLREDCGKEIYLPNAPCYLGVDTNLGDCLKTKSFSLQEINQWAQPSA